MNPGGTDVELYDLGRDRTETNNVAEESPTIVSRLKQRLAEWKQTLPEGA